jgi:formylglycine-generating enzyme required for sulfatase activity
VSFKPKPSFALLKAKAHEHNLAPLAEGPRLSACCVPSKQRLAQLETSRASSANRPRATAGSPEKMVRLEGTFHMGSENPEAFPTDGEGPVRQVSLSAFYISKLAVTNRQFAEFVRKTSYRTEAER